jgi:sugar lactone lactonase YvrE
VERYTFTPVTPIAVAVALDARAELGEAPVWDTEANRLIWVDIIGQTVHSFDPETGEDNSFAVPQMAGVAIPRQGGGLVLAIGHGFGFLDPSGAFEQIADIPQRAIESRMNDGNCDAAGRLWAGTMGLGEEPEAGALYRLDPDLTVTRVLETVSESNGIDWSPDDRLMYHVDSIDRRVDVYEFDLASGSLGDRQQLIAFEDTIPDGLTVDTDGNLWVACWGGYAVRKFSADGALLETVSLPTANITCPVFGGPALDRMFITSARTTLSPEQLSAEPEAGALFVCEPGARGRPQRIFAG